MQNNPEQEQCESCGGAVATFDGVYLTDKNSKNSSRFFCSKCYNESISDSMGVNYQHLSFHPIILTAKNGAAHTFHFRTNLFGSKVKIEALEVCVGEPRGYKMNIFEDGVNEYL